MWTKLEIRTELSNYIDVITNHIHTRDDAEYARRVIKDLAECIGETSDEVLMGNFMKGRCNHQIGQKDHCPNSSLQIEKSQTFLVETYHCRDHSE